MPHLNRTRRNHARVARAPGLAVLAILLACVGLAACGGTSTSSSTSATASAASTGPTGARGGPTGASAGRFRAVRECLQKAGIAPPQRTPGTRRGGGGFLPGAGAEPQLPKGMTRAQYEAALKKCGGGAFRRGAGGTGRLKSPAAKQALATFATCMRENGVNVPEPNTSGSGPVFNTKGLNTQSAQFKAAQAKCSKDLQGAFRGGGGGAPGGPAGAPAEAGAGGTAVPIPGG
jgi:hypothetical protein